MNNYFTQYHFKNPKGIIRESGAGFTLLELVVVLGLFILIMGVAVSIFISVVKHQKRILAQQEMLGQLSFVTDYAARSLRTARLDAGGTCLGDGVVAYKGGLYFLTHLDIASGFYQGVKFVPLEGGCRELFLDADGIIKESVNGGTPQNLVSSKFPADYLRFVINGQKGLRGAALGGAVPPRLSLALGIADASVQSPQTMVLQTTISKR